MPLPWRWRTTWNIAVERYAPLLADADLLRSQAGGGMIPSLDPTVSYNLSRAHQTSLRQLLHVGHLCAGAGVHPIERLLSQGFLTGTNATLSWNSNFSLSNSLTNNFNPSVNSYLDLKVTQHLLQGFGLAVNRRNIRIAQNGRKVSDLAFKAQVITTVATVMNMYWTW